MPDKNVAAKMGQLVTTLLEQTNAGKLTWERMADPARFQAAFPRYTIQVNEDNSSLVGRNPSYWLSVVDQNGEVLERAEGTEVAMQGQVGRERLKELYDLARRQALDVESAIEDILIDLRSR